MPYMPTLLASIEQRLEELAAEIVKLESARTALVSPKPSAIETTAAGNGAPRRRTRRSHTAKTTRTTASQPAVTEPEQSDPAAPTATETRPARANRRRQPTAARAARRRRSKTPLKAEDLERLLSSAEAGLSASAIADRANAGYDPTLRLLRELAATGRVRRDGSRRSTVWRLVTDEDRIAQRAAELERRAVGRS